MDFYAAKIPKIQFIPCVQDVEKNKLVKPKNVYLRASKTLNANFSNKLSCILKLES